MGVPVRHLARSWPLAGTPLLSEVVPCGALAVVATPSGRVFGQPHTSGGVSDPSYAGASALAPRSFKKWEWILGQAPHGAGGGVG